MLVEERGPLIAIPSGTKQVGPAAKSHSRLYVLLIYGK